MRRGIIWKTVPWKLPPVSMCLVCLENVTATIPLNPGEESTDRGREKRSQRNGRKSQRPVRVLSRTSTRSSGSQPH